MNIESTGGAQPNPYAASARERPRPTATESSPAKQEPPTAAQGAERPPPRRELRA